MQLSYFSCTLFVFISISLACNLGAMEQQHSVDIQEGESIARDYNQAQQSTTEHPLNTNASSIAYDQGQEYSALHNTATESWFQVWNRPEYLEWAQPIPEGYLLHIIRKEEGNFRIAKAKLLIKEQGLPGFEVLEEYVLPTQEEALQRITEWGQRITEAIPENNEDWFKTWDIPQYSEWALPIPEGYLLHIIRKEKDNFLTVKAKLIIGAKGLPGFEIVEQHNLPTHEQALDQIKLWKQ